MVYIKLWADTVGRYYAKNLKKAVATHPITKSSDKKPRAASAKSPSSTNKTKKRIVKRIRKKHSGTKNLANPRVSTSGQASLITRRVPKSSLT